MELVFIFTIILIQMLFINSGEVMPIEGALWVDAFVYAEELPVLFLDEGVSTIRAQEAGRRGDNLPGDECLATDLTLVLAIAAIVIIKIVVGERHRADRGCPAGWTFRYGAEPV